MSTKNRIKKIEAGRERIFDEWLESLTDDELKRICGPDVEFTEWLKTLTDDELEIVRYERPGADRLKEKFDEYQKQTEKDRKQS